MTDLAHPCFTCGRHTTSRDPQQRPWCQRCRWDEQQRWKEHDA